MGKTLKEYQNDISEAEKLLADAQKEYREAAMRAFDEGRMEEFISGAWREIHSDSGVKVYCDQCFTISPNAVKHERCPKCGAHMGNASVVYRKVEQTPTLIKINEQSRPENALSVSDKPSLDTDKTVQNVGRPSKPPLTALDCVGDKRGDCAQKIIKEFHDNKMTYSDIGALTELSTSSIANWATRQSTPRDGAFHKLCKAYKDYFGKEYVLR